MPQADDERTVIVTGLGIRSPLGNNIDTFFSSILNDESYFFPIDFLNLKSESKASFFKNRQDYEESNGKYTITKLPHNLLLEAAIDALDNAGIFPEDIVEDTIALVGTTSGGTRNGEILRDIFINDDSGFPEQAIELQSWQSVADYLANKLKLKNGARTIMTACSSGVQALIFGYMLIRNKAVSRVIVGSVNTIDYTSLLGFRSIGINPQDRIRPFDKQRDGFYLGEGAAVLILENLESATARNTAILAKISGFCASSDSHKNLTSPVKDGYAACMTRAIKDSGLPHTSIDYINAHGTATVANDSAEAIAIKECFTDYDSFAVSSTKSSTGHTLGAAGAIESLICIKAINEGIIPPNKNLNEPDGACRGLVLPVEPQQRKIKHVLNNSFGFGGNNAVLILSKFEG